MFDCGAGNADEEKVLSLYISVFGKNPQRILDIGSGPGFFLKFFKDKEWDVVGIEPSKSAAVFSRGLGLKIIQDSIYKINSNDLGLFDLVHSNQVFEHLIAPDKALEVIHEILNPNGLLFLSVANDYNPIQKIAHEKLNLPDWWFIPPEHINYFRIPCLCVWRL